MAFTALILMDLKVNVIMRRFHVPNFTSQLQNVGSIGINSFTCLCKVWLSLSLFLQNPCFLIIFCKALLY